VRLQDIEEEVMRFSNVVLGLFGVGLAASASVVGCGSSPAANTGGASSGSPTSTTGTTGAGGTTSSSSGSAAACAPGASCPAKDKSCIGLVDNTGLTTFGLRMAELDLSKPAALTSGVIAGVVGGAVQINGMALAACNLSGSGTFNWLLQFDTTAGTLETGGAKPVPDPTQGYSFDMDTMNNLAPVTLMTKPDSTGKFSVSMGQDVRVPIFLDAAGTMVVILPLKNATLSGTLSTNQNCIGTYNAAGLSAANSCLPGPGMPQFNDAGTLTAIMTLEDADSVPISALSESLCVLLSGNATMYGVMKNGELVCTRDANNNIIFQGDTCSMAGGTCTDSVALDANFAASSVKIN
jgi:hypothetical protein